MKLRRRYQLFEPQYLSYSSSRVFRGIINPNTSLVTKMFGLFRFGTPSRSRRGCKMSKFQGVSATGYQKSHISSHIAFLAVIQLIDIAVEQVQRFVIHPAEDIRIRVKRHVDVSVSKPAF